MEKKKLNFLLKSNFLKRDDLSECFDKYPSLSWIKDIKNANYSKSQKTLEILGNEEKNSFMKKKTLISISKLNLIAANEHMDRNTKLILNNLNRQLEYLSYFENLPANTLKVF